MHKLKPEGEDGGRRSMSWPWAKPRAEPTPHPCFARRITAPTPSGDSLQHRVRFSVEGGSHSYGSSLKMMYDEG